MTTFTNNIEGKYLNNIPSIRVLRLIKYNSDKYYIPFYVLLGIYVIEATNRSIYHRIVEYCVTMILGLLSFLLKVKIRNYTVGVFQVGLNNILYFYLNNNINKRYHRYLVINNYEEYKTIIKAFKLKYNITVASKLINEFYRESKDLSKFRQIRYIGQKFNGRIEYGIFLANLVQILENNKIIELLLGAERNE